MKKNATNCNALPQAVFGDEAHRQPKGTEYIKNGIIYCAVCNEPKQGTQGGFLHPLQCACERQQREDEAAAIAKLNHIRTVKREKTECFGNRTKYTECTFDSCREGVNLKVKAFCYNYCENWQAMKTENIGLIFCGGVGRGKTHLAACMCNKLIEDYEARAKLITENEFIERYSQIGSREEYMQELSGYSFLVLDEFGVQSLRQNMTPTGYLPFLEDLINRRYAERRPLLITTNLSKSFFTNSQSDIVISRIQSRLLEMMAAPIAFVGKDLRADIQKEKIERIKHELRSADR